MRRWASLCFALLAVSAFGQTYCGQKVTTVPIPTPTAGTTIDPTDYSTWSIPAVGSSYTEPDITGTSSTCKVYRATDQTQSGSVSSVTTHNYATQSPFNADDSLLAVGNALAGGYIVLNPAAGYGSGVVVSTGNMPTGGEIVWDTANPLSFYYGSGANVMKGKITGTGCSTASSWSGAPNCTVTTTTLYTSSYANLQFNEQDISYDGLHFWIADGPQDTGSTIHFLLMTLNSTDATSATLTTTVTLSTGYHKPGILPNNYLYINPSSGNDAIYTTTGSTLISTLNTAGGHIDFGYDPQTGLIVGVSVFYAGTSANGCTDGNYYGGVGLLDLQPGDANFNTVLRCLSDNSPENYSGLNGSASHYSMRDTAGVWEVSEMETQNSSLCPNTTGPTCFNSMTDSQAASVWDPRMEEIIAFNLSSPEYYLRLVHHRSRENASGSGYWSEPRPAISRDGKYIAFDSNFDDSTVLGSYTADGRVNVYVIPFQVGSDPPPPNPPTSLTANVS